MSTAKADRAHKRKRGQFLTPPDLAAAIVGSLPLGADDVVCEPGFGDGSFVLPLVERLMALRAGSQAERLAAVLSENIVGAEIDPDLYARCLERLAARWGPLPPHRLVRGDFLAPGTLAAHTGLITWAVGNPPFGASFDPAIEDWLDSRYGVRIGRKIKKESYAFFAVKSLDLLAPGGRLALICSDTFLSISTMAGLRSYLRLCGDSEVERIDRFSGETDQPVVLLRFRARSGGGSVRVFGSEVSPDMLSLTANGSWLMDEEYAPYFRGPSVGDRMVATGGMTTGRNEYFVREIVDGSVEEWYDFEFYERPITAAGETARARLGRVPPSRLVLVEAQEAAGETQRCVRVKRRDKPVRVALPHPDYRYYNKASGSVVYAPPSHAIFWRDEGDAVIAYKKAGNWYLRGVGGGPFFGREGLTWQLISSRLKARYLPPGYILDSGAPCAFLRPGVAEDELYFILGWTVAPMCTRILKGVLNHTRNIQGKDFERLPYPFWVPPAAKAEAVAAVRAMVREGAAGRRFHRADADVEWLATLYDRPDAQAPAGPTKPRRP